MATVFESIPLNGLRRTHLEQLLAYVNNTEREGWYYGPKKQFLKRHQELKAWLEDAVEYATSDRVVLPKKGR